jgi:hypothetical protein
MANDSTLNTPVLWINKYLQYKLPELVKQVGADGITAFTDLPGIGVPLFPSMPTSLDSLTEQWVIIDDVRYPYAGVMATWDRLIKMNRKGFPHIKSEQVLYYFYATAEDVTETMVQIQEAVLRLLDRFNESAEEVNNWCSNRQINLGTEQNPDLIDNMFYFHNFKVYQLEETRDIIDFGTARTYGGNKIIIDFDYHQMPDLTVNTWAPEPKLATKIVL